MDDKDLKSMVSLLEERNLLLQEKERDLRDRTEELQAQKEELTAAIEELASKNNSLITALETIKVRNEELDKILYRTSHDLRTPLSSLKGLLDLLKAEALTKNQKDLHTMMEDKVLQMSEILRSLTSLADVSFGKIIISSFNVKDIFEDAVQQLKSHPNFSFVKISFIEEAQTIKTDINLFRVIIRKLLSNALTFRPPVEGNVVVSVSLRDNQYVIKIEDDGEGIPDDIQKHVFEMFYRGSIRSKGAGLGLYVVKNAVQRLKGEISVSSKSGKTTFQVVLPEFFGE